MGAGRGSEEATHHQAFSLPSPQGSGRDICSVPVGNSGNPVPLLLLWAPSLRAKRHTPEHSPQSGNSWGHPNEQGGVQTSISPRHGPMRGQQLGNWPRAKIQHRTTAGLPGSFLHSSTGSFLHSLMPSFSCCLSNDSLPDLPATPH